MPPQNSLTAEVSSLNSCSPLSKHNAIAGILNKMILWPLIIFNFYSPAISTKFHSTYFRKESKKTSNFFPWKPDSISESKVQIKNYYYRFLDTQRQSTKPWGFFLHQNKATSWCKQNQYCAQHFSSCTMCPLKVANPQLSWEKSSWRYHLQVALRLHYTFFIKAYVQLENNSAPMSWQ